MGISSYAIVAVVPLIFVRAAVTSVSRSRRRARARREGTQKSTRLNSSH